MIFDFHSHFLPFIDDGPKDMEISLKMLGESMRMGVTDIVSTSHCYAYSSAEAEELLKKRDEAIESVKNAAKERGLSIPNIYKGTEVHLTCDISQMRAVHRLCIEGTNYMLLEMPSSKWNDAVVESVYKLSTIGITPIIAHMERNLIQSEDLLNQLYSLDLLIQINAESFGMASVKKYIDTMMKNKMIHIIGTDMHNLENRKPNIDKAQKYIIKRFGADCWTYLMNNAETVLSGNQLGYRELRSFKKKSMFGQKVTNTVV